MSAADRNTRSCRRTRPHWSRYACWQGFAVPYARLDPWPAALGTVRDAGFTLLALTPADTAVDLASLAPHTLPKTALMLGAEGDGLTPHAIAAAHHPVRIPMAHGIDSLNVGAAAAVAFYAVTTP
ncbi:TrmH family RNA methyltransferase [Kitasatospora sp. NPDC018058]|uniref:TrmH family RNA methyltransferase n=1 Tax=Kitasatospora sp. NPDC018058 TaxID=3364025 RepID=UPI0037C153F8